jgi:hypothetical protein
MRGDAATTFFEFLPRTAWTGVVPTDLFSGRASTRAAVGEPFRLFLSKQVVELLGARDHTSNQLFQFFYRHELFERTKTMVLGMFVSQGPYGDKRSAPFFIIDDLCPSIKSQMRRNKKPLCPIVPVNFSIFIFDKIWKMNLVTCKGAIRACHQIGDSFRALCMTHGTSAESEGRTDVSTLRITRRSMEPH